MAIRNQVEVKRNREERGNRIVRFIRENFLACLVALLMIIMMSLLVGCEPEGIAEASARDPPMVFSSLVY